MVCTGGGTYEYVVPYTANYEVTLAGAQGASYSSDGGGYGYVLTKQIRLQYNDVVKFEIQNRPTYSLNTATGRLYVPGGQPSKMWVNGTLVWTAAGGAGKIDNNIAPNSCTNIVVQNGSGTATGYDNSACSVHWHSCSTKSGATHATEPWGVVYSTTFLGGCYGWDGHTHDATGTCPWHYTHHEHNGSCASRPLTWLGRDGGGDNICPSCGRHGTGHGAGTGDTSDDSNGEADNGYNNQIYGCDHGCLQYDCDNLPLNAGQEYDCGFYNNTQSIHCGYSNGQVLGYNNNAYVPGNCYYNTAYAYTETVVDKIYGGSADGITYKTQSKTMNTTPSASLTRQGNGMFSVKLVEQSTLNYLNVNAPNTYWKNGRVDLAILDNTVCFFKRR